MTLTAHLDDTLVYSNIKKFNSFLRLAAFRRYRAWLKNHEKKADHLFRRTVAVDANLETLVLAVL